MPAPAAEEVPFITTPDQVTREMLRIAEVGPADHVIDLGSGDGRIVIAAAREFGATGLGVEIVPALVRKSIANAQAAGVAARARFVEQDIFKTDLSAATVVTMYLLDEVNLQLRPQLLQLAPGTRIVSHDWDMRDWYPDRTVVVSVPDKAVGRERSSRVHLWRVPAPVDGLWCAGASRLRIVQRFQDYEANLQTTAGVAAIEWRGRISAAAITAPAGSPVLRFKDGALIVDAPAAGLAAGVRFVRMQDGRCAANE